MTRLLLASASPRRHELLARVGLVHEVVPADVDETARPGEEPTAYVMRIALAKAQARATAEAWVLAADTTVEIDGAILAKAESADEAKAMLRRLVGRTHRVATAFVILGPTTMGRGPQHREVVISDVTMRGVDGQELDAYVDSGEWRGKAGAYAVQGIAAAFVTSVRGSITNIVGLPLAEVISALASLGGPQPDLRAGVPA